MTEPYKPGTLVRVKESALTDKAEHWSANLKLVAESGYLYIVEGLDTTDGEDFDVNDHVYLCKSLATGEQGLAWFHYEIEGANNDQSQE
jgi:hypothetical protein